jgi:hypothetical protein
MTEQETNPFDVNSYSNTPSEPTQTEPTQTEPTQTEPTQADPTQTSTEVNPPATEGTPEPAQPSQEPTNTESNSGEGETNTTQKVIFEWENEVAKDIYENLTNGNISEVADILYEQKVLSELDSMQESDVIKLKIAYDYPELSPEEIEEEFQAKYGVDKNFDDSLMTEDEIASKRKQIEKQEKAIARELKKDVREAKDYLQTLKQDISFPDILSQFQEQSQQPVNTEEVVSQYLKSQEEEQSKTYQQAREMFEKSIEEGLKGFEGFNVNYKDEEVQFDGNYSLSPE